MVLYSYAGGLGYSKSRYSCSVGSCTLNSPIGTPETRSMFSKKILPHAVFIGQRFSTKSMVLIRIALCKSGSREECVLRY